LPILRRYCVSGMQFTHLHVHSNFSLLDGAAPLCELVEAAKAAGMETVALTDHDSLAGAVRFYQAAQAAGIKPIIGAEFTVEPVLEVCHSPHRPMEPMSTWSMSGWPSSRYPKAAMICACFSR